jgi:hypothetical protein
MHYGSLIRVILIALVLSVFSLFAFSGIVQDDDTAYARGDYESARLNWLPAAMAGDSIAQYNIGFLYKFGLGVTQDYKQAAHWFRQSAELGDAKAQYHLASLLLLGLGVPRDFIESANWTRKAADQGDTYAQYVLGTLYQRGYGVLKDNVLAFVWYDISFEGSKGSHQSPSRDALSLRDSIAKKLTPGQLLNAQQLSASCRIKVLAKCVPVELKNDE